MHRFNLLFLPLALTAGACDTEEPTSRSGHAPRDLAVQAPEEEEAAPERESRSQPWPGPRPMLDRLCGELNCSDEQRVGIEDLVRDLRPDGPPDFGAMSADKQALADAFRADTLDPEVLIRGAGQAKEQARKMKGAVADGLVGVHAILRPEQRAILADRIERRGARWIGGRGRGKKHGRRGKRGARRGDGGEHHAAGPGHAVKPAASTIERLCERVSCTEDQAAEIKELVTRDFPTSAGDERIRINAALARAFRGEGFGPSDVEAHMKAVEALRTKRATDRKAKMVAVHGVLTPEQRAIVADRIEEFGLRGFMGHGPRGRHGRGSHR